MTRRFLAVVVLVALALLSATWAADDKDSKQQIDLKKMKATIERLESPVTLEFVGTPLADVLKFFEDYSKIKFDPEAATLPDKAIKIHLEGEPFALAIQKVLEQCNWTFAVRPDGNILLRPVPPAKK